VVFGTWNLVSHEENYVQKVSENRVVKGNFGSDREEVREGLRKLHSDEVSCFFTARQISLGGSNLGRMDGWCVCPRLKRRKLHEWFWL
jgi:hypothetical protein